MATKLLQFLTKGKKLKKNIGKKNKEKGKNENRPLSEFGKTIFVIIFSRNLFN